MVLEPKFIPEVFGRLTFTADYWKVKQKGLIGVFGEGNALILDYLLRQSGSSNPNVVRAAVTADDVAAFAGTGLAAAGQVLYVNDKYTNLQPQDVEGLDLGLLYRLKTDKLGDFDLNINAAHLIKYYQSPSPGIAELLAARTADEWETHLEAHGVPAARVRTLPEAIADPQLATRDFLHKHDNAAGVEGAFTVPSTPFKLAHGGGRVTTPPPPVGADTDAVLGELGYDQAAISKLRAASVI